MSKHTHSSVLHLPVDSGSTRLGSGCKRHPKPSLCLFPSAVTLEFNPADLDPRTLVGDLIERNVRLYIAANESDF